MKSNLSLICCIAGLMTKFQDPLKMKGTIFYQSLMVGRFICRTKIKKVKSFDVKNCFVIFVLICSQHVFKPKVNSKIGVYEQSTHRQGHCLRLRSLVERAYFLECKSKSFSILCPRNLKPSILGYLSLEY